MQSPRVKRENEHEGDPPSQRRVQISDDERRLLGTAPDKVPEDRVMVAVPEVTPAGEHSESGKSGHNPRKGQSGRPGTQGEDGSPDRLNPGWRTPVTIDDLRRLQPTVSSFVGGLHASRPVQTLKQSRGEFRAINPINSELPGVRCSPDMPREFAPVATDSRHLQSNRAPETKRLTDQAMAVELRAMRLRIEALEEEVTGLRARLEDVEERIA